MGSEGNMPRKIFEVPFLEDPRPDIYKQLTQKNAEYPITDMDRAMSYLPDFTRAVELSDNIYRINVPGYFYKCPAAGSINSSGKTGIIIDRYAFNMDNYGHHPHRYSWVNKDTDSLSSINDSIDGLSDHECFVIPDWKLYVKFQKDDTYTGKYKASFYKDSSNLNSSTFRPVDFSDFAPSTIIEGVSCQIAVRANMRLCPETDWRTGATFCRSLAMDYIVNTGKNSSGGIMNCLSAIIPGVATTTNASGTYQGSDGDDIRWSVPALGEVVDVNVTQVYFIKGKKLNNYYCAENELKVDGILEAKGTYVYPYRASGTNDKILFVPAKAVGDDVKPVTKIRSTSSSHCTYNIPNVDTHIPLPNTSCSIHKQYRGTEPVWGKETGTSDGVHIFGTVGDTQIDVDTPVKLKTCGPVVKAHKSAFDTVFREIFYNPSLTGHKAKFLVQKMTLQAFPGTSNNKGSDITDSVTVNMLDPTSDGV